MRTSRGSKPTPMGAPPECATSATGRNISSRRRSCCSRVILMKTPACCCFRNRRYNPNNHGQVGRHYFGQWVTNVTALFPSDINIWYGLPAQGTTCDEWADDHFDRSEEHTSELQSLRH